MERTTVKHSGSREEKSPDLMLPTQKQPVETDLSKYTYLFHGEPKVGKTTFASSFPDALFFMTEPGAKGLEIFSFNSEEGGVTDWNIFKAGVDQLEKNPGVFANVVIDTGGRAYDMCRNWTCAQDGLLYPGDDHGKGWHKVSQEFTTQIERIIMSGRGVIFTSHTKVENMRMRTGNSFQQLHPRLSGQCLGILEPLCDLIWYFGRGRNADGEPVRFIMTEGSEMVFCGSRQVGEASELPAIMPLTKTGGYDMMCRAFAGEPVGIDPTTLHPSKTAAEPLKRHMQSIARNVRSAPSVTPLKKKVRKA